MFFGVIFLSMPLAIVGDNFTATWALREKVIFVEKVSQGLNGPLDEVTCRSSRVHSLAHLPS